MADEEVPLSNRNLLLTTAARQFATQGIAATNLKSIAAEVGVSAPAIYYHFQSKQVLAYEAFKWAMEEFNAFVISTSAGDPISRLAKTIRSHVTFKLTRPEIALAYSVILGNRGGKILEFTPEQAAGLKALERDYYNFLHGIVDDGLGSGAFRAPLPALPIFAIISMCEFVPSWYSAEGPYDTEQVARGFVDYALAILDATESDRRRAAMEL